MLLSSDGHVSLTDFNVAAKIRPGHKLTAFAGSLAYVGMCIKYFNFIAPEVFQKRYTFDVDFWSLGVTFYELIYGKVFIENIISKRPFRGKNHDLLVKGIMNEVVTFPKITRESVDPSDCINFISLVRIRNRLYL